MTPLQFAAEKWLTAKRAADEAARLEKEARTELEGLRAGAHSVTLDDQHVMLSWIDTNGWRWDAKKLKAEVPNWQEFGATMSERLTVVNLVETEVLP
jgi:hypothetical protein